MAGGAVIYFFLEIIEALIEGMGIPWEILVLILILAFGVFAWGSKDEDETGDGNM